MFKFNYIVYRLREPSSWAAIMGILAGFGVAVPPGLAQNIAAAGAGIAGIIAFFLPEGLNKAASATPVSKE